LGPNMKTAASSFTGSFNFSLKLTDSREEARCLDTVN
jgi:hypothetical protein